MPSFSDIANKKLSDTVKAPLPPAGTYKGIIKKVPEVRNQGTQWEVVDFLIEAQEARDVDTDSLEGFFAKSGSRNFSKIAVRKSFMFNKEDAVEFQKTENNLKRFLIDHLQCMSEDGSYKQGMAASLNCPVIFDIVWKPGTGDNADEFFANCGKTAPINPRTTS